MLGVGSVRADGAGATSCSGARVSSSQVGDHATEVMSAQLSAAPDPAGSFAPYAVRAEVREVFKGETEPDV